MAALGLSVATASTSATASASGKEHPKLVRGAATGAQGSFIAGPDGADYALPGGGQIRLRPGAMARILPTLQALALDPGSKTPTYSVVLRRGSIEVDLPADERRAVVITTTSKPSFLVRSGHVGAGANHDGFAFANYDGRALTSTGRAWTALEPSARRTFTARGIETGPTIAPPDFSDGRRVFIANDGVVDPDFAWAAVSDAESYEIDLHAVGGSPSPRPKRINETHIERAFSGLAPGLYEASLRTIDRFGTASTRLSTTRIHVVGTELPAGAFMRDGSVYLADGQKAHFTNLEGLEMTYGNSDTYFKASDRIGFFNAALTTVRLRAPGSSQSTTLKIVPRHLVADVEAGPKRVTWPAEPVELRVTLPDADGAPLDVEAVPHVSIGIDPIEVQWKREGNSMTATVPPQPGPGPWVVRVEVTDQFGLPLGRDFVEVVSTPPHKPNGAAPPRATASHKKPVHTMQSASKSRTD